MWPAVSGFMGMGLVSWLSLTNRPDSGVLPCVTAAQPKMDAREKDSTGGGRTGGIPFGHFPNSSVGDG